MKEAELRDLADCVQCGKLLGQTGLPIFYKVTVERHVLVADAIRRQTGLEMMTGSPVLSQVIGPNEDMTKCIMEPTTVMVCENCSHKDRVVMGALEKFEGE